MSVESISRALRVQGLTATEKLVLIGIANHDGDGGAWPSIATLAMYADTTDRTVQRSITGLVDKGFVEVEANAGGTAKTRNDRRPNRYILHFDGVTEMSPRETDGVTSDAPRGDTAVSPEPSSNHPGTSSLRSEDQRANQVVRDYWDWYVAEHDGAKPTIEFHALRAVAKRLIKSDYVEDEIIDAMKTSKAWTAKALSTEIVAKRHRAAGTTSTVAVAHVVVKAFAAAEPWLRPTVEGWSGDDWKVLRNRLMLTCSRAITNQGFDIGETMIRLAICMRAVNVATATDDEWYFSIVRCNVERFSGELANYPDAMRRAYTNQHWNVA